MRTRSLEAYGLHPDVLSAWEQRYGPELLPAQARAVVQHGLFEGRNLIVLSPTSSGKTLVGEMAAAKVLADHRRCIFVVPFKALAQEKHDAFAAAYAGLGIRVACSTRDHRASDAAIRRGEFDVLVGTLEKVRGLLSAAPTLLPSLGLLVVDELQLIADRERGPCLDVLVTQVRVQAPRCQIVCLSAVLGEERRLAEWLGADWLRVDQRPVELRRGVLCDGTFRYVEHNTGAEGEEDWRYLTRGDLAAQVVDLAAHFANSNEQTLIFLPTKSATERLAQELADRGSWGAGESVAEELHELEATRSRRILSECMPQGVAIHNADLSWGERALVERAFRDGALMLVCATSTLGTGVNLPAKNVILDAARWETLPGTGDGAFVPITKAEFENISGRAGRLHQHDDFGRAIILADSEFRRAAYMDRYIKGPFEGVASALASADDLADPLLQLAAASPSRSTAQAAALLSRTCAGTVNWSTTEGRRDLDRLLDEAARKCSGLGLMWDPDPGTGERRLTALGQIAAAHGVAPADFAWLLEKGDGALLRLGSPLVPAALLIAVTTPYVRALPYVPFGGRGGRGDALSALSAEAGEEDHAAAALVRGWLEDGALTAATLRKAARRVLALRLWLGPDATEEVEEKVRASAGSLAALAEACAWLVGCLADVGDQLGWPSDAADRLRSLARRLPLGAPDEGLGLADLRCPGFGRDVLRVLLQNGIASPADIAAANAADLARLLPRSAIAHLGLHLHEQSPDSTPTPTMAFRSVDPDHIVVDGAAVRVRPAEMKLARLLAHHAGDCVPYDRICEQMWGEGGEVYQKQVFVHKSRLLRQLARALPRAIADALIVAVPGVGLRMDLPRERISFA